ncbi:hypothetical protein TGGT1_360000 [Toxoplasma gondii GT1]|uniref:Uncharacterized protein n=1 Tax=Toxoplasma gondii (strain ATCC 50853 / GT1) TaxID=507601 RepID=S7V1T7_TOXGG|nr:hypothetical protein TGGT1_360000 [Toxoplasma gondii GT1]
MSLCFVSPGQTYSNDTGHGRQRFTGPGFKYASSMDSPLSLSSRVSEVSTRKTMLRKCRFDFLLHWKTAKTDVIRSSRWFSNPVTRQLLNLFRTRCPQCSAMKTQRGNADGTRHQKTAINS